MNNPNLWTTFGNTVYGQYPWDDFCAFCSLPNHTTVVTTDAHFGGTATWFLNETDGIACYVGDTVGAYIFGDFMVPSLAPVDREWSFSYNYTTDRGE